MKASFALEGFDGLERALTEMPKQLQKRVIKKGIVAMGRHFVVHMRSTLLQKTDGQGDTARSIKNSSGGLNTQFVRISSPVWHLLEYGTDHRFHRSGHYTGQIRDGKFSFVRPTLFTQAEPAKANFEARVRVELEKIGNAYL